MRFFTKLTIQQATKISLFSVLDISEAQDQSEIKTKTLKKTPLRTNKTLP